jgi:ribosomal protein L17
MIMLLTTLSANGYAVDRKSSLYAAIAQSGNEPPPPASIVTTTFAKGKQQQNIVEYRITCTKDDSIARFVVRDDLRAGGTEKEVQFSVTTSPKLVHDANEMLDKIVAMYRYKK